MSFRTILSGQGRLALALLLFFILLTSLLITGHALQDSARFQHLYSPLLVLNSLGLAILVILIGINLYHLIEQLRHRRPGAHLALRLVAVFVLLTAPPVLIVYYFSLEFLHQRLDSWLDVRVEQGLDNALKLSQSSLAAQARQAMQKTQQLASLLSDKFPDELAFAQLQTVRNSADSDVLELALLNPSGRILAFDSLETDQLLPSRPDESLVLPLNQKDSHVRLENLSGRGLYIRAAVRCCPTDTGFRVFYALYPVPGQINELAAGVESSVGEYKQLGYLRQPLKRSYTLVLSLVLLLSVLGSIWMAFFSARRLVAPIRDLVEGTRAVAEGDYAKQLPGTRLDELGVLVQSFNEMTRRLALARDQAQISQNMADAQRAYLQVMLERLSSGVLSLDQQLRLRTSNAAADQILGVHGLPGEDFLALCQEHVALQPLCQMIEPHLRNPDEYEWHEQLAFFGLSGRKILMCRGTRLPASGLPDDLQGGHVLVFDDITNLIQAQRDAAWGEVARRLAHEIKNPLTPIRLSAERLRHKYLPTFPDKEAEVLDRMTHTIIQQVEALKEMVNAFSEYARSPEISLKKLDLNQLANDVVELYRAQAGIETQWAADLPPVDADPLRLRQVLHNLLKNALEAQPDQPKISVSTSYQRNGDLHCVELRVIDNGPGITEKLLENAFEPYVTSKTRGSGLGLAIVKKIVEEHGGMAWLENLEGGGACAVIRLPAARITPEPASPENTEKDRSP
jgi:nitrogen fixation/metabolism regulation signal transduction histidine kinase